MHQLISNVATAVMLLGCFPAATQYRFKGVEPLATMGVELGIRPGELKKLRPGIVFAEGTGFFETTDSMRIIYSYGSAAGGYEPGAFDQLEQIVVATRASQDSGAAISEWRRQVNAKGRTFGAPTKCGTIDKPLAAGTVAVWLAKNENLSVELWRDKDGATTEIATILSAKAAELTQIKNCPPIQRE